jgi:hypothetical protein
VTEWNSIFAYATLEMGVGVELCWPYRAQQKGSVENLVGFVKSSFFKVRRFHDEEDLRQQLQAWHGEVNEQRPCRATGVIPAVRWAEEKPRLRPLKVQPEDLALRIPVYVGPTATVLHDGHAYDAAGGDQYAGHVVLVWATLAHRSRSLCSGAPQEIRGPRRLFPGGASVHWWQQYRGNAAAAI